MGGNIATVVCYCDGVGVNACQTSCFLLFFPGKKLLSLRENIFSFRKGQLIRNISSSQIEEIQKFMSEINGHNVPNKLKEIINCKKTMQQLAVLSSLAKVEGEKATELSEKDKNEINEKCGIGKDIVKKKSKRKSANRAKGGKRSEPIDGLDPYTRPAGKRRKYEFGKVLKL